MSIRLPIALGLALALTTPSLAGIRKQCQQSCGTAINLCVAANGGKKRHKCSMQVRRICRQRGIQICVPPPTTATTALPSTVPTTTSTTLPPVGPTATTTSTLPHVTTTTSTPLPPVGPTTTTTSTLPHVTTTTTTLPTTTLPTTTLPNYSGTWLFTGQLASNTCPVTLGPGRDDTYMVRQDAAGDATATVASVPGGVLTGSVDPSDGKLFLHADTGQSAGACEIFIWFLIDSQGNIPFVMASGGAGRDLVCSDP